MATVYICSKKISEETVLFVGENQTLWSNLSLINASSAPLKEDSPPVYKFLPPTDDLSHFRLFLAMLLISLLTIGICGNVSHLALQIYSRRLHYSLSAQSLIAILFVTCFLVPLGLPCVILEKLVNIWMFGPFSCHSHHIFFAAERVLIPWIMTFLHIRIACILLYPTINPFKRLKSILESTSSIQTSSGRIVTLIGLVFLTILFVSVVIPQAMTAHLDVLFHSSINEGRFIMEIQITKCILDTPEGVARWLQIFFECALPMLVQTIVIIQIYRSTRSFIVTKIVNQMFFLTISQFVCNFFYYLPMCGKEWLSDLFPTDIMPQDIPNLLPFAVPALVWVPAHHLSVFLSLYKNDKVEDRRELMVTSRHVISSRVNRRQMTVYE